MKNNEVEKIRKVKAIDNEVKLKYKEYDNETLLFYKRAKEELEKLKKENKEVKFDNLLQDNMNMLKSNRR